MTGRESGSVFAALRKMIRSAPMFEDVDCESLTGEECRESLVRVELVERRRPEDFVAPARIAVVEGA